LLGARFSSSVLGDPVLPPEITYSNTHAKFVGGIFTSALASTYSDNSTIKAGRQSSYEIEVAPGAARVGATLGTDENADLDLYLFDCTGAQCVLRDFANGNGANEQVAVDSPAAGKWKVVIDPFAVPDRGAACQYKDYFLHPALGRLEAADGPKEIDSGALVTQPVTLNVKAIPIRERYLEAILFVTSELPVDTSAQKNDQSELYYPTRGILATASVRLKPVAFHPPGR
jgi:hypothetical protein